MNQTAFAVANILDKVRKVARNREVLKSYWQTYVLSRLVTVDPEVYVISYPKCGRTWLRVMLQEYLRLQGYRLENFHDKFLVGTQEKQLVKFEHGQSNWVPAPLRVDQLSFNASRYAQERILFLVRDPRDVLVSSWYHLNFRERIYKQDLSAFIRDDLVGIRKVVAFMNLWVDNSRLPKEFLLLSYEDMHTDPISSLRQVVEFIGIEVGAQNLRAAVGRSSFDRMKRMEKSGGLEEPWLSPGTKGQDKSMKVRRGKVGSFRDDLSESDVAFLDELIRQELSVRLRRYYR